MNLPKRTDASPVEASVARKRAEALLGPIQWRESAIGLCECPGAHLHSTKNGPDYLKVVVAPSPITGGTLPPGLYCFHKRCQSVVAPICQELRRVLGGHATSPRSFRSQLRIHRPTRKPEFDPAKLERCASKLPGVDAEWLAARSPKTPANRYPASFLHELYCLGEQVLVFTDFRSQGDHLWTHRGTPFDAGELESFRWDSPEGVWFLTNPVDGEWRENDNGVGSRRSAQNITAWRYMVLESDSASPGHWLSALVQMPLPISAIYSSGGRSIHALVRIDATSKPHWDELRDRLKSTIVTLGADPGALSAVRLSRLPNCNRLGKKDADGLYHAYPQPQLQSLLYLNPSPKQMPICEMPIRGEETV